MESEKITEWRPTTLRRIGKSWLRSEDDVIADLGKKKDAELE
jgi:hypothetical protein